MSGPDPSPSDLYAILGVPRTANQAAIKAAFRRLAVKLHPDTGGDPEQFRLLKMAYDVLSDPDLRAHYDQTGETPADQASRMEEDKRFRTMAGEFLVNVIVQAGAPQFNDMAELARGMIAQNIAAIDQQLLVLQNLINRVDEVRKRLRSPNDDNLIGLILGERIEELKNTIEQNKQARARWQRLGTVLKDYRYDLFDENLP